MNAALHEDAGSCGARDGGDDHERRRQAQLRRGGEDEERHDHPDVTRDDVHDDQKNENNGDEPCRDAIREFLDGRLQLLGSLDERDDSREHRVSADLLRLDVERSQFDNGSREDLRTRQLFLRHALARDRRLIHGCLARSHDAIDGDLLARSDDHDVAHAKLLDRDGVVTVLATHNGGSRHGPDERLDRRTGAIGIELGDEFRDQDDDEENCAGNVLVPEHRHDRRHGHEDFRPDFVLAYQVEYAGLHERIEADSDAGEKDGKGKPPDVEQEDQDADPHDASDLDPAIAGDQIQ